MKHRAPALGEKFLRFVLPPWEYEALVGDFEEIYRMLIGERGPLFARLWYWIQVLKFVPSFIKDSIIWSVTMFRNYMKIALRNLGRHKGYSFINIAGLAIGLACSILILLWVKDELSYDRYHENTEELYAVRMQLDGLWWGGAPWALAPILKEENPEIIGCTRFFSRSMLAKYEKNSLYKTGALVDDDFMDMFTYPFVKGNPESAFSSVNSIVVTEETAESLFGSEDPMGKIVTINNNWNLTVTGVIENVPSNSTIQFDFFAPVRLLDEDLITGWSVESVSYVLLQENVDVGALREKIAGTAAKYDKRTEVEKVIGLQPLTDVHLHDLNGTGPIIYIYIFSTIAIFILLIACINYMNLMTARASSRAREICMRKIVGAHKKNLVMQYYGESFVFTGIAMVIGIILVFLLLSYFNNLSAKELTLDITNDTSTLLGLIAILLVTAFLSGSYPAVVLSSFNPLRVLKGSVKAGSTKSAMRRILVTGQFATTAVLIIATIIMYRQLDFMHNKDLGLDKKNVVIIPLNRELNQNYEAFKTELMQDSRIINVTNASSIPTSVGNMNPVYWEGKTAEEYVSINFVSVDYDYFETFGMEMIDGRSFSKEFTTDETTYIINEEAAKLMNPDESPVGKMFSIWTNEGRIIGVVKNFHSQSLHSNIRPIVFTLGFTFAKSRIFVKIQENDIQGTLGLIEKKAAEFAPGYTFEYTFFDDWVNSQYSSDERTGVLFRNFSLLAVIISCLGIMGLASFMAEQRTKEIGIRKVLGASQTNIIRLISREFMLLLGIANIIAWPLAYYGMYNMLNQYAYRTNIALWVFIATAALTLILAFLTVSIQTLKVAGTNPVKSLRYE